ncbi:hypothetical protein NQ318_020781, partial [Aromia moschata]
MFHQSGPVDGILGADLFPQIVGRSAPALSIALETDLGYIVMGKSPTIENVENSYTFCSIVDPPLEKIMQEFLEIENIPTVAVSDPHDKECEEYFQSTYKRDVTGKYTVSLPFQMPPSVLGESYSIALRRFCALERILNVSENFRKQYHDVIKDYLSQDHMRKVDSSSTPLRIVFDASCKTNSLFSLNDILHKGPKLHTVVLAMFLKFRIYSRHSTDVLAEKSDTHKRFQRLLWRFSPDDIVETYELTTLAFGMKTSPSLALRVVRQLAIDESRTYPLASDVILRDMYIDYLVTSISDLNTARYIYQQLVDLFESGGFNLVKWRVNSKELLDFIPKEKLVPEVVNFETDCLKVLGMQWHPSMEVLFFKVNIQNCECTKRNILSTIARIFDPLGLVAPVTLYTNLLVKKLWSLHLNWDECPPPGLLEQWSHFQLELPLIDNFSVPRHIGYFRNSTSMALGFADACESSYGCVIYLRTLTKTGIRTRLICAKSKISPLKVQSIPGLKLCAAVLLAKLFKFILDALGA